MTEPVIWSWHMSRRVPLPVAELTAAFDRLWPNGGHPAPAVTRRPSRSGPGSAQVIRRRHTRLQLPGLGAPVAVEVELEAWSRGESQLGVRPAGRPPSRRARTYFRAAEHFLDDLTDWLLLIAGNCHSHRDPHRSSPRPLAICARCGAGAWSRDRTAGRRDGRDR